MEIILLDDGCTFEGNWNQLEDCFGITKETLNGWCINNSISIDIIKSVRRNTMWQGQVSGTTNDILINDIVYTAGISDDRLFEVFKSVVDSKSKYGK